MSYNMSNFSASNNVLELAVSINEVSNNWLSYAILIGLFIIVTLVLVRNNNLVQESFFASSTLCTIVSLLFLIGGLINIVWVIGFTLIWSASAITLYLNR